MNFPLECMIVRADASPRIGHGHALRCLALAQAWNERNGRTVFAMAESNPSIADRMRAAQVSVVQLRAPAGTLEDATETAQLAAREEASWIVVDGYRFSTGYQRVLSESPSRVLCIDDDGRHGRYESDIVLNQNPSATLEMYGGRRRTTKLLLGLEYALLRQEFSQTPAPPRTPPPVARKLLVTLGGADPDNVTLSVIRALGTFQGGEIDAVVLVGGSNPHRPELEKAVGEAGPDIRLVCDVQNMREWILWADGALTAAGSTIYELAYLGVPMLLLVLADNQAPGARRMAELGAARNLGPAAHLSPAAIASELRTFLTQPDLRSAQSAVSQSLLDGRGAERTVAAMREEFLRLRAATQEDARFLFELANDSQVRAASFSSEPIAWDDHERWLRRKLADPNAAIFIAEEAGGTRAGVVRFDIADGTAIISVALTSVFRGRGHSSSLLDFAARRIFLRPEVQAIRAFVKAQNQASARAFVNAGFIEHAEPGSQSGRSFTLSRSAS